MPLYEYECAACGHRFEKIQRFSDPLVQECVSCGSGPVHKLLSAPAIQFKGTGWYITDYAGKKPDSTPSTAGKSEAKSESKTDTASASSSSTPAATPASSPAPSSGDKK